MRLFGLIGYPLSHSFSKKYFTNRFKEWGLKDHAYELFAIEQMELFPSLIKTWPDLVGMNVTIPYKQKVMEYLDEFDESAADIGAVNTITFKDGKLKGFNTDVYGFEKSLLPMLQNDTSYKALVLGSGGASKGICWVLRKLDIPYHIVSRRPGEDVITYDDISPEVMQEHLLVVNTTPLGMSPNADSFPNIPYDAMGADHIAYDLVYNPETTLFMQLCMDQGAATKNGLEMLHLQADRAWEIWNME